MACLDHLLIHITVVLLFAAGIAAWHPYDHSKPLPESCKTFNYNSSYTKVDHDIIQKYKLWPNMMTKKKLESGETMFGFVDAMDVLWKNQHPPDCKKAKYLIAPHYDQGFACEFHYLGVGLAIALALNRVYIYPKPHSKMNSHYAFIVNNTFCRDQNKQTFECYYEPWTHCTWEDAIGSETYEPNSHTMTNTPILSVGQFLMGHQDNTPRTLILRQIPTYNIVPTQFIPMLECSPFAKKHYQYWWRSVAIAFMLRPNAATLQVFTKHENDPTLHNFNQEKDQCISVHIRHGGKHIEMKMVEDVNIFFDTAKILWDNLQTRRRNTIGSTYVAGRPHMFVGTEDPVALGAAVLWGRQNNWTVMYTNLFDRGSVSTRLDWHTQMTMRKSNSQVHDEMEYLSMLMNIDYHLQCSGFVCTHGSNWCRMLDELRATVVNKADAQFAEMSCVLTSEKKTACIDEGILNDKVGY